VSTSVIVMNPLVRFIIRVLLEGDPLSMSMLDVFFPKNENHVSVFVSQFIYLKITLSNNSLKLEVDVKDGGSTPCIWCCFILATSVIRPIGLTNDACNRNNFLLYQ
jgi:hypothetical protein